MRDFSAIARVASTSGIVAVHPSTPIHSVKELIAAAKAQPGKIAYASCGSGTPQHLSGELLRFMAKIELIHVPARVVPGTRGRARRAGPGSVQHGSERHAACTGWTAARARGHLPQRFALEPELPTVAEAGLPGYDVDQWFAVLGPAGIPTPVVETLNREIVRIVSAPALRERLVAQSFVPAPSTSQELERIVREDIARWSRLIQQVGIRVD